MNLATLMQLFSTLGDKAPAVIAFLQTVLAAFTTLAASVGKPLPTATARAFTAEERSFIQAHKLGDGTLLTGLEGLLNSPFGAALEALLLKLLGSIGTTTGTGTTAT